MSTCLLVTIKAEVSKHALRYGERTENEFKENYELNNYNIIIYGISYILITTIICALLWRSFSLIYIILIFISCIVILHYTFKKIFWMKNKNALNEFYKEKSEYNRFRKEVLVKREKELYNERDSIYDYLTELNTIPKKYWDSLSFLTLLQYFKDGRVDTIKEAINLLEQERYQEDLSSKIKEQNDEIRRMRNETLCAMRDIEKSVDFNTFINSLKK